MVWEMSFEEFQDSRRGGQLGYRKKKKKKKKKKNDFSNSEYVTVMPPIKFRLNLTNDLGGDFV